MRKQSFYWSMLVVGIVATVYGGFLLRYHLVHNDKFSVLSLVLLIIGIVSLLTFLILYIPQYIKSKTKKNNAEPTQIKEEVKEIEPVSQEVEIEKELAKIEKPQEEKKPVNDEITYERKNPRHSYCASSSYSSSTVYVRLVGYGQLLRINGNRILDMRANTYYYIENVYVTADGYGVRYEINGNSIKDVYGGYLFELSGGNLNKTFGGYYASVSGNYITLYDGSQKYEMSDSLSKKQILVVAALLFQ